ncbi:MAG: hypothetical protein OXE52_14640 [Chloroflexi bacterium]|nr:hypothetical protein [Chloroflexota bacterium]
MKIRLVAVVAAALTLCGLASAQIDNCCFVDRQCSSNQEWTNGYWAFQNGQCVAPASSGPPANSSAPVDNCCGIDRQCSTDAEWLSGWQAYQNNQCAAPAPPQPAPPTQPVASTPATVDNCCFVDRQCSTDLEWMAGWHAYQNNQCAAPAPPQPQSSPAPVGNIPANVDNCCRVNRQCATERDWTNGWAAYKFLQCRTDIPIPIDGSPTFINWMSGYLNQLRDGAPQWYHYVITGLRKIREVVGTMPGSGKSYINVFLDTGTANYHSNLMWEMINTPQEAQIPFFLLSSLVHEACHVHRYNAGLHTNIVWKNELPCYQKELELAQFYDPTWVPHLQNVIVQIKTPGSGWRKVAEE